MKINERLLEIQLIDYYGCLLTEHQLEVLKDYYYNDYSMIEISENYNVSKSAISDLIKRSINQLYSYEDKLKIIAQSSKRRKIVEELLDSNDEKVITLANKLLNIEIGEKI